MATITFENVRDVKPYYDWDLRVLIGFNAVPNYSYADKASTIKSILEASRRIPAFIDDLEYWGDDAPREARIRLHTARETVTTLARVNDFCFGTISQISFADRNHRVGTTDPPKTVHIEMDSWYFENYPLGYCTGMLCHEFAVHSMANYEMRGMRPLTVEAEYKTGVNAGNEFGRIAMPKVTPSTAGQPDHVFAAYPEAPRHDVYRGTLIDVALVMSGRVGAVPAGGQVAVTAGDVTDLFKCFLMDVASIQCTNDHRAKGIVNPGGLADCFNAHRRLLLDIIPADDALRAFVPAATNSTAVVKDFIYLLASLAWSLGPSWSKSWSGY
jgi:hypothetical protein